MPRRSAAPAPGPRGSAWQPRAEGEPRSAPWAQAQAPCNYAHWGSSGKNLTCTLTTDPPPEYTCKCTRARVRHVARSTVVWRSEDRGCYLCIVAGRDKTAGAHAGTRPPRARFTKFYCSRTRWAMETSNGNHRCRHERASPWAPAALPFPSSPRRVG